MRAHNKALLFVYSVFCMTFFSCKDNVTGNQNSPLSHLLLPSDMAVTGVVDICQSRFDRGTRNGIEQNYSSNAFAQFVDRSFSLTGAGVLKFDADTLVKDGDNIAYTTSKPLYLEFDGKFHMIYANGGIYPAFTDSLKAPAGRTEILSPHHSDILRRTTEHTISWNPGTADAVLIKLVGRDKAGRTSTFEEVVPNTGSYIIPSSVLRELSAGTTQIGVRRYNYKAVPISGHGTLLLMIHSDHFIDVYLDV